MTKSAFVSYLEELSAQIVLARPDSRDEMAALVRHLEEFRSRAIKEGEQRFADQAQDCRDKLALALEEGEVSGIARVIELASVMVTAIQSQPALTTRSLKKNPKTMGDEDLGDALRLPEWVEEKTFLDFLVAQQYAIDEIEGSILELEKGLPETLIALRRRVHTAKGEAGAVGQDQIERVLHAMEDVLETLPPVPPTSRIDYLLVLKDWLASTVERLRERKGPQETAEEVLERAAAILAPPMNFLDQPGLGRSVHRDDTTRHLIAEFLNDVNEDLAQADQLLVSIEQGRGNAETIHSLFRIFHSNKGIAGFLALVDIVNLTHATENLLNLVREGTIKPEGEYLEVIFLATDWFRRLTGIVLQCLEAGREVEKVAELEPFLLRIEKLTKLHQDRGSAERHQDPLIGSAVGTQSVKDAVPPIRESSLGSNASNVLPIGETVRVDLGHVDNLVELIGELMIIESMVLNSPEVAEIASLRFKRHVNQLTKISRDLQRSGMQLRMVPVRGIFQKMSRLVRDLARKSGKDIRLDILGEGTEMDRSMVEQLADPLIHLIRNSVDHGIELPEERIRQGKRGQGEIHLAARHEGGSIAIEIRDDGRGLDRSAIYEKAVAKGLIEPSEQLGDADVQRLLFLPGFSTAKQVSEISGRGVGLDVVKKNIESMRGRVLVNSTPGQGTAIKLVLPLTLAIIDGMLIGCGPEKYIIPTLSIVESIKPTRDMIKTVAGRREIINIRGEILALFSLGKLFQIANTCEDPTEGIVIVIESFGRKAALLVDEVITQQQVVIKGSGDHFSTKGYFSGATILADGRVGLILNAHELCSQGDHIDREHRDHAWTKPRDTERKQQ